MESNRQKKLASVLQKDLALVMQRAALDAGIGGILFSVTSVKITPDMMLAKVYVSIFPSKKVSFYFDWILTHQKYFKTLLAQLNRNDMRRFPELQFFLDDSQEQIDKIERSLKEPEDPIKRPELLPSRKKL